MNRKLNKDEFRKNIITKKSSMVVGTDFSKVGLVAAFLLIGISGDVLAFDLGVGVRAVFDPVIAAVNDHYGKAIVGLGATGSLVAQGDLRTRGIGFIIGAAVAGLAMVAVKAGFGV